MKNSMVISKTSMKAWIEHLGKDFRLIGPKPFQDRYVFGEFHDAAEIDLNYPAAMLPLKKILLPQREDLIAFGKTNGKAEPVLENRPTIVLGAHTCDLHAIASLDHAFLEGYIDQHYRSRREHTLWISLECLEPCSEHAFCKDMGTLVTPDKFDLHLTDLGDDYVIDIGSERGAALLHGFDAVREAGEDDYRQFDQVMSQKWSCFPYRLEVDFTDIPRLLATNYRSVLWDELGERCLGCGACTLVCPTCFCFNVIDEVDFSLHEGKRYRTWDSCQLNEFALVAGGHDFRPSRAERLRHRFFHKYKNQVATSGLAACVGCGRCAEACIANITPMEVLNSLHRRRVASARHKQEASPQ